MTSGGLSPGLLLRYRVMAFTTATLLIVLVFVGIPLQVAARRPQVVNVVGTMHGFLYIVYLFVAFSLTRRLRVPRWQMALVLLAGTVPFCAFVAERKMSRRWRELGGATDEVEEGVPGPFRQRWLSRRALLLHLGVAVVAPGCALAGWWQATRALGGNELSWVYSVEWPIFALIALGGWWQLVHEDPETYRARKSRQHDDGGAAVEAMALLASTASERERDRLVDAATARLATRLAVLVGVESVLGVMSVLSMPFSRPSGLLPSEGVVVYLTHSLVGLALLAASVVFVVRERHSSRVSKAVAWMGCIGLALAGAGGLLSAAQQVMRFLGMAVMLVGALCAASGYLIPAFLRRSGRVAAARPVEPRPVESTG